jgi:hypothetical protein
VKLGIAENKPLNLGTQFQQHAMKKFSIEFKWGIIYTAVYLLWMVLEKAIGLHDSHIEKEIQYTNFFILLLIPVFILALRDKKTNYYHGNLNWTQAFLSGVIVAVIAAILSPLAQYIVFNFISPDFFKNITEYYISRKQITPEKAAAYFSLKSYIIQNTSFGISISVIISAIVALFVKSKTV